MTTEPKSDPNHSSSNTTGYSKNGSGSMKHHVQAAATNNLAVVVNDQINMSSLSSVGLSSSSESSARLLLNTNNASVTPSSGIKVSPVFVPSTSSLGDIKPVVPAVAADDEASCMVLPAIPSPLSSASSASVNNVLFSKRTSSLPSSEIVEKKLMGGIKGSSGNNNKPHNTTTTAASTVGWVGLFSGIIPKSVSSNSSSRAHFVINEGGSSSHQILKEDHQDFELGGEEEATALSKSSSTKFTDNRQSVADMFNYITKQEKLLEKLDNSSAKFTLARLERENQLLELNPKTILAESGTYRTTTTTLHDLKSATAVVESDSDIEFWDSMLSDYSSLVTKIPHLLNTKIRGGIPFHLRPKIWMRMCNAQPDRLALLYPSLVKEDSPFDRIIKRDLPRTFPKVELFKDADGIGQKMLYNLLKAYSIYDSEVGYCQGLSFVVGPLLMQNMTEVEAFSIMVRLMEESPEKYMTLPKTSHSGGVKLSPKYSLRTLFTPQMKGLHLMLFQHTQLVKNLLPALYDHFQKNNINATMYASQWFLTMFAYNFPFPLVFRIFDIIFAEGADETILRFSVALLKKSEQNLLAQKEFEGVLSYLKEDTIFTIYDNNFELLVRDAMNLSDVINEAVLEKHKKEFEKETLTTDEELANMRNLVQQLRNDSAKMVETLRDLSMRNAVLERDHTSFQVFKKGAMIEIDGLRHELDRGRMNIELLITDKSMLENEVAALKKELSSRNSSGSVSSSSENGDDDEKEEDEEDKVHELEVLRMKVRDLEYIVEHFACPMSADPRQQMELEQK